jgi:transposase-like protein
MNSFIKFKEEKIEALNECIEKHMSLRNISKKLVISVDTLKRYIKMLGIDYHGKNDSSKKAEYYLNNDVFITASALRKKLLDEGIQERKCECCGLDKWMGGDIPLELHHINGNHNDNRIENLEILCSNCHSMRHGYSKYKKVCKNCGVEFETHSKQQKFCSEECKKEDKERHLFTCEYCGKEFYSRNPKQRFCSKKCSHDATKLADINKDNLLRDFYELKTFVSVGKKYGVSDNAVRKWCKKFGLPASSNEMKNLIL